MMRDRVGIGWRPDLAAGILSSLDRVDVIELIADDYFDLSGRGTRALRTLARQVPLVLHGVSLGGASSIPVEIKRVERLARLIEALDPLEWSEHLAFVRAGGLEIGHLAAPPRTNATVDGTARNFAVTRKIIGTAPLVENVATLIEPPGSDQDEATWITQTLEACSCDLLLDLHNVYANATNFHFEAKEFVARIPPSRIRAIHLAGGKWIRGSENPEEERLLDDHLHDVPDPVYELLKQVASLVPHALTVILERDGAFPPMRDLLAQIDRAREALREGRALRAPSATNVPMARLGQGIALAIL